MVDLLADPAYRDEDPQSHPILGGGAWLMVGQAVAAGRDGWRITFPPGRIHQRASRGIFGRVERCVAVQSIDRHAFYLSWERLPEGYINDRGVEQALLDALDPIRRPDEKRKPLAWHGCPAMKLTGFNTGATSCDVQAMGLAVVAGDYRYVAIALAWDRRADRRLMKMFVDSLRPGP